VARGWRIRQKLMLAHLLVLAIVGLLLAGTLYGMASYGASNRAVDKKVVELRKAEAVRIQVKTLADPDAANDPPSLRRKMDQVLDALDKYQKLVKEHGSTEVDYAKQELDKADALRGQLEKLDKALNQLQPGTDWRPGKGLAEESKDIRYLLDLLNQTADDLITDITSQLYDKVIEPAKNDVQHVLWLVFTTAGVSVVMLVVSLRFFFRWFLRPIRDLQQGVDRVATGDFKHRIELQSADEIQELAAAFNDMTRRLDEMYTDLARQVNERSRQLVRSERLASVGFLAAGVAHEINNPLASIVFCSEALERRILDLLSGIPRSSVAAQESEVIAKYLKMIQEESLRCKEITSRLLDFSRGGERQREPVELDDLIRSVIDMAKHLPSHRGKTVEFLHAPRIVALVNAQEIKSVVVNLVVNSLDSMDEGGKLAISLGLHDGMAEMVFRDTGCGMAADVLENIFEPFFTRSRSGKGTGLGLSICHRIISQHQGDIEATSAGPDQGSTFTVRLPLQPAEAGPGAGRPVLSLGKEQGEPLLERRAA
jgi:signal transduction histidine kinase